MGVARTGPAGSDSGIHIPSTSFARATASQDPITVQQGGTDVASNSGSFTREEELTEYQFKELLASGKFSDDVHYKVTQSLRFYGASDLKFMPKHLTVQGKLMLIDCPNLKDLSKDLTVEDGLTIHGCCDLNGLPDGLTVGGNIDLQDCPRIKHIPNSLSSIKGDLKVMRCPALKVLPKNLSVEGDFTFPDSPVLEELPKSLSVGGNLDLSGCARVETWPDKFSVKGALNLSRCKVSGLDNVSVGGGVDFSHTDLVKLPSSLRCKINGHLDVSSSNLEELPSGLTVTGEIYITNCRDLKKWPAYISQDGERSYYSGCGSPEDYRNKLTSINGVVWWGQHIFRHKSDWLRIPTYRA